MSIKRSLDSGAMEIGSHVDRESGRYEKSKMHKAEINNMGTSIREIKGASASCLCDVCANFAVTYSFNDDEIEGLRKVNTHEMLHRRKLHLVLNLDHTLLTRAQLSDLTPEEEEYVKTLMMDLPLPLQDVVKVQDRPKMKPMIFKLRPFVRAFLKEASGMFEIYAYTNASRPLVWKMVELLDPRNEYFGRRVISREDFVSSFAGKKCLDLVLAQESTVLILDHKQETWMEQNQKNIVLTQKYQFFKERSEQNSEFKSHCELITDEGVYLAVILQHLKLIHSRFFDDQVMCDNLIDRDVRKVLETLRGYVLKGCKIAFDPLQANKPRLWKMAEQLGANCVEQLDPSVTHVVAAHVGTLESHWAVERNKFLVHPSWIEASNWMWEKSHEDKFPVIQDMRQQKMAEQLGTTCDEQMDLAATQLVVAHVGVPARSLQPCCMEASISFCNESTKDKIPVIEDGKFTCCSTFGGSS